MEQGLNTKGESSYVRESLLYIIVLIAIFPMILGLISDYFCTHFLSVEEVSVLGLSGSVDTLLTAMVAVFAIGAQAVCAKDLGEGNREESSKNFTSLLIAELLILFVLTVIVALLRYPIAELIGADEEESLMDPCAFAIFAFAIGMPGSALNYLLSLLLYMERKTRRCVLYATLLNTAFSFAGQITVTLTGPTMAGYLLCGIAGDWVAVVFMLFYMHRHSTYFRFVPRDFSLKRFLRIFFVGLPGGLEYFYYAAYEYIVYLFVIRRFPYYFMSVFELKEDIGGIAEALVVGMCILLVDRFGMAVGSRDAPRIRRELKRAWIACLAVSMAGAVLLTFVYPEMVDLFIGEYGEYTAEIAYHACFYLICTCIGLPFYVANNIFTSVYEVQELLGHVHLNYFIEVFGFITVYCLVLGMTMGITGIWIAYPLAEISTLVVNFILLILHNHRLPKDWMDMVFPKTDDMEMKKA